MNMRPISVVDDDKVVTNWQSVVPMEGLHSDRTVLDPILAMVSTAIDLPVEVETRLQGPITQVVYPGGSATVQGDSYVLKPYMIAANNLLRLIADCDWTTEDDLLRRQQERMLAKSVNAYLLALVRTLSGKKGLINRQVLTRRADCSLRAVAIAGIARGPEWVGIPRKAMEQMGRKDGDLFTMVRFPCLWDGSVEIVRCYAVDHDCVVVHPVLHRQFGLDHDGDTLSLWAVPKHLVDEAEQHVLSFYKAYDEKVKPYPIAEVKGESWDTAEDLDVIHAEVLDKLAPTGKSIGPEDLISGDVAWYEQSAGKELLEDTRTIASGIDLAEIRDRVVTVNSANLIMKRYVGPAGALGTALKVIGLASKKPEVLRSAMYINERLTQSLMDAKHAVGGVESQGFMQVMDALNLQRDMEGAKRAQVVAKLVANGMEADKVRPFCDYFFVGKDLVGVKEHYANYHSLLASSTSNSMDEDDLITEYRSASPDGYSDEAFTAAVLRVFS